MMDSETTAYHNSNHSCEEFIAQMETEMYDMLFANSNLDIVVYTGAGMRKDRNGNVRPDDGNVFDNLLMDMGINIDN